MPLSPTSELLNTATHGQRKKYFIAGKILQISLKLDHGCGIQRLECTVAHQKVCLQLAGDVLRLGGDWFWLIVFELGNDTMADDLLLHDAEICFQRSDAEVISRARWNRRQQKSESGGGWVDFHWTLLSETVFVSHL